MNKYKSSRLDHIEVSEILQIGARAAELRRSGADVIVLGAGEPDFDTPAHIKVAAARAIQDGKTKYTALEGTPELREAVCRKLKRENGLDYLPTEVIVSTGAKQVIFNALAGTLEPGDEVILPAPFWTSYSDMVSISGGVPVIVHCPEHSGFKLDAAQLERAITARTRWLFLNSPSNPTGAAYTPSEFKALADILARHPRVLVLSDEIYEHILYDALEHVSPAAISPELRDRILVVNGVSKAYAMTGWRIGWGAGPRGLIEAMAVVQSQVTSCASSVGQAAALAALDGPQDEVRAYCRAFEQRRDVLVPALNAIPGVHCRRPDGAFYAFPSLTGLLGATTPQGVRLETDKDVTRQFLESAHVAVVPGSAFAMSGYFRISYAASLDSLKEACTRLMASAYELTLAPGDPAA